MRWHRTGRGCALGALLLLAAPAPAEDEHTVAGMEAAVRGDWVTACEEFAQVEGDPRGNLRLSAARAHVRDALGPAVAELLRGKEWPRLAEVVACGLAADPHHHRFTGAAKRLEKEGVAELPAVDERLRPWATYGLAWGEAEELVAGCLGFLRAAQEKDGHWDCAKHGGCENYDVGVTALALLALLPYDPAAADRAAAALRGMQEGALFGTSDRRDWPYNHTLALQALAEYAIATGRQAEYGDRLARAAEYLVDAQNLGSGWRYGRRSGESDTSVTMRAVVALRAAERAGVKVDPSVYAGARGWAAGMTEENFRSVGYNFPGGLSARTEDMVERFPGDHTAAMTAAGWLIPLVTGQASAPIARGIACVDMVPPETRYPDMYYWDAGSRLYVAAQGRLPDAWYAALRGAAKECRADDGGMRACGPWGEMGGRVYANAITALALEAPLGRALSPDLSAARFLGTRKRTVEVAGWGDATATGIYVESGTVLDVSAQGTICPYDDGPEMGPEGLPARSAGRARPRERSAPVGCLLGRIDDGKPFVLKTGKNTLRGYGHLWLFCNEEPWRDNLGWWQIDLELVR